MGIIQNPQNLPNKWKMTRTSLTTRLKENGSGGIEKVARWLAKGWRLTCGLDDSLGFMCGLDMRRSGW